MARSHNQKIKILILEQMLHNTGENCVVTMQEILDKLGEYGISAERKSIYDDIEALRDFGFEIRFRRGKPGGYYLVNHEQTEKIHPPMPEPPKVPEVKTEIKTERIQGNFMDPQEIQDMEKTMKLCCNLKVRESVQEYFGEKAELKIKNSEDMTVVVPLLAGPHFYGWLAEMGREVHILKPKKSAAAYRDYLKSLAKDYKGI